MQKNIFVIDDNDTNLTVARNTLEEHYNVITLSSAARMFVILEKKMPDLILLDIEMPEMTGYEAIKLLREDDRYKEIPVIFLTSKTDERSELEGFQLGAADYVSKPFSAPLLLKRIENQLLIVQKTNELKAASIAKSNFLANMSHEIRTPMNAIVGMTHIGRHSNDIEKKDYAFDKITLASNHLLGVINDILDVSKIEAGKLQLSPRGFNFDTMLQAVMNINNYRVEEKKQALTVDIDESIPKALFCDEHRLAQVITNLLANAVKFTPERGTINISARLINEVDGLCTVQFDVTDSGIGISPEQQDRLFNAFQQAEADTSMKFGGTGLGLAISKSIVEMMGGTIWIKSELGKGATFSFTITAERMEENVQTDASDIDFLDVKLEGRRILLAEDIEINREIVIALLEPTLVGIECAENGKQAVTMWSDAPHTYDMILMDVLMPEMDGYEATRTIRAFDAPEAKTVPIVAMTANVFREDVERSMEAGMNAHLGKPIILEELMGILEKYLS